MDKTIPVNLPIVNKKINLATQIKETLNSKSDLINDDTHEKILTLVGTAITIVAAVKYLRESTSILTVNIWWAQTKNLKILMAIIAQTILKCPKINCLLVWFRIICEIIPNPGKIKI